MMSFVTALTSRFSALAVTSRLLTYALDSSTVHEGV